VKLASIRLPHGQAHPRYSGPVVAEQAGASPGSRTAKENNWPALASLIAGVVAWAAVVAAFLFDRHREWGEALPFARLGEETVGVYDLPRDLALASVTCAAVGGILSLFARRRASSGRGTGRRLAVVAMGLNGVLVVLYFVVFLFLLYLFLTWETP